jgi:hypothetical protein
MECFPSPRRLPQGKKIWEIESCYKCSLIGTCLTRTELRKLAREYIFAVESGDDYRLHADFIRISDRSDPQGKALHKYLAKKYQIRVKKYLQATTDQAIKELWDRDMAEGLLDSAWWSVLTHPTASNHLVSRLYGYLHMLGHDSLNSHHKEQLHSERLRTKVAMLGEVLGSERQHYRQEKRQMQTDILSLQQTTAQLRIVEQDNTTLHEENLRLRQEVHTWKSGIGHDSQQQEIDDLRQTKNALIGRIDELGTELESIREEFKSISAQLAHTETLRQQHELRDVEQAKEIATLENLLMRHVNQEATCSQCADQHTANCPGLSLCGRTVLYVGGRNNLIPHYRQMVEQCGGRFLHHDGGKEASRSLLPKMLTTADAVLCPIDCVSHDACNCVKKMCKRYQKPFVLMRSAGLSSLAKGLSEIVH